MTVSDKPANYFPLLFLATLLVGFPVVFLAVASVEPVGFGHRSSRVS